MAESSLVTSNQRHVQLLEAFPASLRRLLTPVLKSLDDVEEIRIVQHKPLILRTTAGERFVGEEGLVASVDQAVVVAEDTVRELLDAVTRSSVYALEDAIREGYLPLPGGHRVGLVGEARTSGGEVCGFRHITGFNIRVNREVPGASLPLLKHIVRGDGSVWSTLVISPPGAGKTTLLRDVIRVLSYGDPGHGLRPHRVGVADERGELAGGYRGVAQNDLGPRADVIDLCPKRYALSMLVRTMGPEVVVTDEIGHPEDGQAVLEAITSGVTLICSAHGSSPGEIRRRPSIRSLLEAQVFGKIVVLSRRRGPGTIERVVSSVSER